MVKKNTLILIQTKEKIQNCFKLMNNSIFGKKMENLRKRVRFKLVDNAKEHVKSISKPSFFSQKTFSKNFAAIHEITLNT